MTYVTRSYDPYRGFETFINAMEIVQRQRPRAQVLVVGGASEKGYGLQESGEAYRRRVLHDASLDQARIHFLGPLNYDAYLGVLRFSQVHVYLTVPFVLSWSLIEAMSVGCAIVGSRTAPVEEVISDGNTGLLAEFYAPDQVAAQVIALLDDALRRLQLGRAARQRVMDDYSIASVGPRFAALIDQMTA